MAEIARRRGAARSARSETLRRIGGDQRYEAQQTLFDVAARVAREERLSRLLYAVEKPALARGR